VTRNTSSLLEVQRLALSSPPAHLVDPVCLQL